MLICFFSVRALSFPCLDPAVRFGSLRHFSAHLGCRFFLTMPARCFRFTSMGVAYVSADATRHPADPQCHTPDYLTASTSLTGYPHLCVLALERSLCDSFVVPSYLLVPIGTLFHCDQDTRVETFRTFLTKPCGASRPHPSTSKTPGLAPVGCGLAAKSKAPRRMICRRRLRLSHRPPPIAAQSPRKDSGSFARCEFPLESLEGNQRIRSFCCFVLDCLWQRSAFSQVGRGHL